MRVFYDKSGKRISREAVREMMNSESDGLGVIEDRKINQQTYNSMTEEEYAKLNGLTFKDFKK